MSRVHSAAAGVAVVISGVVLGSGLGGYASAPPNDTCLDLVEGGGGTEPAFSWLPFGTRCVDVASGRAVEGERFASSVPLSVALIVAMTALVAVALRRDGGTGWASTLGAAVLLALYGIAAHNGTDFVFTFWIAVGYAPTFVFLTLYLWRPKAERSFAESALLTIVLIPVLAFAAAFFDLAGAGELGVPVTLLTGAAIGSFGPRLLRRMRREAPA